MLQKKTVKNAILDLFADRGTCASCDQIVKYLMEEGLLLNIKQPSNRSASVSTILNKLVKKGTLQYARAKTDRGGHIYEIADRLATKPNEEEDE